MASNTSSEATTSLGEAVSHKRAAPGVDCEEDSAPKPKVAKTDDQPHVEPTDYAMVLMLDPDEACDALCILIPRDELSKEQIELLHQCAGKCRFDPRSMLDDRTGLLATVRTYSGISKEVTKEECGELPYKLMRTKRWRKRNVEMPGWMVREGSGERIVDAIFTYWYPPPECR